MGFEFTGWDLTKFFVGWGCAIWKIWDLVVWIFRKIIGLYGYSERL